MLVSWSSLLLAALSLAAPALAAREVFAHVIVGNTAPYTSQDFANDVAKAASAGIDGFALNIGGTSYDSTSLTGYYQAAQDWNNNHDHKFYCFISFDYAVYGWTISEAVSLINQYKTYSSQFTQGNNQPFVSTFLGTQKASDWNSIKSQTGAFFMPDYHDTDPNTALSYGVADGLFSWLAWPNGQADTPDGDAGYKSALQNAGNKPYMMPVSPWFYTQVPSKNWMWHSDELWTLRWAQVYQYQPDFVELVTWNDYGESHYIGPLPAHDSSYPTGSQAYCAGQVHDAWLSDLPYYIQKYKNGGAEPAAGSYNEHVSFWYRPNPKSACDPGTMCNSVQNAQTQIPAVDCAQDTVNFAVFTDARATVTVQVGNSQPTTVTAPSAGYWASSVPYNGATGSVKLSVGLGSKRIETITGPEITDSCALGHVNWNPWVGGGVPS